MNASLPTRTVTAIVVGVFLIVPSASAAALDDDAAGTTWTLSPAAAGGPDDRVSLRHVIPPGSTVDDHVALTNFSPHAATFAVYASDGIITDDGAFDLLPPGEKPVDAGAWIDIGAVGEQDPPPGDPVTVDIPAQGSVVIPLTIAVPDDASPGDHPAGVVAQLLPDEGAAVEMASRVGVRVHLRVDGPVTAALGVEDPVSVSYEPSWNPFAPGTVHVEYTVGNTGNVRLEADSVVTLSGPLGIMPATDEATIREVLPGTAVHARASFRMWPLLLGFGDVDITPHTVGEDALPRPADATTRSFTVWTVPWAQLALLAVAAAIVVVTLRVRRRAAVRVQRRIDAAVAQAVGAAGAGQEAGEPVEERMASRG